MIKLNPKLFWKSYKEAHGTDGIEVLESIDQSLRDWLEQNILNRELFKLLIEYPIAETVQLCAHYLYSVEDIKNNTEMYQTINKSYITVGSSANGDWISIPKDTWETIGYISHEEFGYDETDLLKYCPVSKSIGEFYYNSWHIDGYPYDYYSAIRYNENNV